MTVQENIKMIAEFMEDYDFEHTEGGLPIGDFSNSWDWLMPVVEKMNKTELWDEYDISDLATYLISADIKATYNEVVEFINQHKNK